MKHNQGPENMAVIGRTRQMILLQFPNGIHVPVPFDLDMSGLVNAFYAAPAPDLPISTVKQRYYQGFCHPGTDWDSLFEEFSALHEDSLNMLAETPGLERGDRRMSRNYLDSFFETLESGELRTDKIVNACRPWPP
jgi:hypothetical protein